MDHLMKLITMAREWSYVQGEKDVNPKHLDAAAEQLTLRRDVMYLIASIERKEETQAGMRNHRRPLLRNEIEH